jgi:hypothetical protein
MLVVGPFHELAVGERRAGADERDVSGARTRLRRLTSGSSRCLVLVEEPGQYRSTADPAMNRLGNRRCRARRPQPQRRCGRAVL